MNKIVLENYPASKLPEELREGIAPGASVKVTVEEEARKPMTREKLHLSLSDARARASGVSIEDAVARIRELREEWEPSPDEGPIDQRFDGIDQARLIAERRKRLRELFRAIPPPPPGATSDHSELYDEFGLPK